jgi:hypothetical protein
MLPTSHHIYSAIATLHDEELARAAERHHALQPRNRRFARRRKVRTIARFGLTLRQA